MQRRGGADVAAPSSTSRAYSSAIADFELAGCLDVQRLDHAVVDHHRVALGTDPHARAPDKFLLQTKRPA